MGLMSILSLFALSGNTAVLFRDEEATKLKKESKPPLEENEGGKGDVFETFKSWSGSEESA